MKYKDFIDEIRLYLEKAKVLINAEELNNDQDFRKWRHNLTDLIDRIEILGYQINTSIKLRYFNNIGLYSTLDDKRKAFNRDIQDTIIELEAIISNFDKFGDPIKQKSEQKSSESPLNWPQKITLSWLFKHAPLGLWAKVVSFLVIVFILGITVGQSKLFHELKTKLKPKKETTIQSNTIGHASIKQK